MDLPTRLSNLSKRGSRDDSQLFALWPASPASQTLGTSPEKRAPSVAFSSLSFINRTRSLSLGGPEESYEECVVECRPKDGGEPSTAVIVEQIATQTFSHVYKAYFTQGPLEGHLAAVKILTTGFSYASPKSSEVLNRLYVREVTSLMQLDHPHIVRLLGVGEAMPKVVAAAGVAHRPNSGQLPGGAQGPGHAPAQPIARRAIFLEWMPGGDARTLIDQAMRPMDEPAAASIIVPVARALEACHRAGIVHRDLKASNILLAPGAGQVCLADWGISVPVAESSTRITDSGSQIRRAPSAVGTEYWCAPEVEQGLPHDQSSDIFSLAVTYVELVTGRDPKYDNSEEAIAQLRLEEEQGFLPDTLSEDAREWLVPCLSVDPRRRPSISALLGLKFFTEAAMKIEAAAREMARTSHSSSHFDLLMTGKYESGSNANSAGHSPQRGPPHTPAPAPAGGAACAPCACLMRPASASPEGSGRPAEGGGARTGAGADAGGEGGAQWGSSRQHASAGAHVRRSSGWGWGLACLPLSSYTSLRDAEAADERSSRGGSGPAHMGPGSGAPAETEKAGAVERGGEATHSSSALYARSASGQDKGQQQQQQQQQRQRQQPSPKPRRSAGHPPLPPTSPPQRQQQQQGLGEVQGHQPYYLQQRGSAPTSAVAGPPTAAAAAAAAAARIRSMDGHGGAGTSSPSVGGGGMLGPRSASTGLRGSSPGSGGHASSNCSSARTSAAGREAGGAQRPAPSGRSSGAGGEAGAGGVPGAAGTDAGACAARQLPGSPRSSTAGGEGGAMYRQPSRLGRGPDGASPYNWSRGNSRGQAELGCPGSPARSVDLGGWGHRNSGGLVASVLFSERSGERGAAVAAAAAASAAAEQGGVWDDDDEEAAGGAGAAARDEWAAWEAGEPEGDEDAAAATGGVQECAGAHVQVVEGAGAQAKAKGAVGVDVKDGAARGIAGKGDKKRARAEGQGCGCVVS